MKLHSQDPIKRFVFFLFLCLMMAGLLTCCSPQVRAYKKLEKAYKLAPELFKTDTVSKLLIARPPKAEIEFDCIDGDLTIEVPRSYNFDGEVKEDTVKVSLKVNNGTVHGTIDCPPIEKEIQYIPQPYPVEKPLSDWQKFKIAFPYILGTAIITGMIILLLSILKKFSIKSLLP